MQKPSAEVYKAIMRIRHEENFVTFYNWLTKESISLAIDAANTNDEVQVRLMQGEHRAMTRLLKMIDESRDRMEAINALEAKRGTNA